MSVAQVLSRSPLIRAKSENDNFRDDIIRCFDGEGGGIGFHGYVGEGGNYYAKWLADNDKYRSQITLAEVELTTDSAESLAKLCPHADSFLQVGASGSRGDYFMKVYPLIRAILAESGNKQLDYKIADVSDESFKGNVKLIQELGLPFKPELVPGNFYVSLPKMAGVDVVDITGITIENPPFDALQSTTDDILLHQLACFRQPLNERGVLIFSYANGDHIDPQGNALKQFYDDPLIHAYQKTIFSRIKNELSPTGNFDENNFHIRHEWEASQRVLRRFAVTERPMQFAIGNHGYDWEAGHKIYMSNNTRYSDDMIRRAAKKAGFIDTHIFGPPKTTPQSDMRIAALING